MSVKPHTYLDSLESNLINFLASFCSPLSSPPRLLGRSGSSYLNNRALTRFGIIGAIQSIRMISKREEILTNYGLTFESGPIWYKEQLLEWMEHRPGQSVIVEAYREGRTKEELKRILDD